MVKRLLREPVIAERFGKLVITGQSFLKDTRRYIPVVCDCGKTKEPRLDAILKGVQVSCGCHRDAQNSVANLSHGMGKAGAARHPMYHTWSCMVQRITNPKATGYCYYGGKGITVDNTWLDFKQFKLDMEDTWFAGASLDRKEGTKGYCKDNCRWATDPEQAANRSSSYRLEYLGETYSLKTLADKLSLNPQLLRHKLNRYKDLPIELVITSMLDKVYLTETTISKFLAKLKEPI